jgi:hypothetical protein
MFDRTELDQIIHNAQICHLACSINDEPYVVPLAFGYDGKAIYFHTAKTGKKIDILSANPRVCLGFEEGIQLQPNPDQACEWSFVYKSVIATGIAKELTEPSARLIAIQQIMQHYSGRKWDLQEDDLSNTKLWRVEVDKITGKKSPAE